MFPWNLYSFVGPTDITVALADTDHILFNDTPPIFLFFISCDKINFVTKLMTEYVAYYETWQHVTKQLYTKQPDITADQL